MSEIEATPADAQAEIAKLRVENADLRQMIIRQGGMAAQAAKYYVEQRDELVDLLRRSLSAFPQQDTMRLALMKIASGCTTSADDIDNETVLWMQGIARQALSQTGEA